MTSRNPKTHTYKNRSPVGWLVNCVYTFNFVDLLLYYYIILIWMQSCYTVILGQYFLVYNTIYLHWTQSLIIYCIWYLITSLIVVVVLNSWEYLFVRTTIQHAHPSQTTTITMRSITKCWKKCQPAYWFMDSGFVQKLSPTLLHPPSPYYLCFV